MSQAPLSLTGFHDPAMDGQRAFRAILDAMSRPGTVRPLDRVPETPAPLYPASGAFLIALADHETPVWLDPACDTETVRTYLRFYCGCRFAERPDEATFALVADAARMPPLDAFDIGTDEHPERSTTLIVQVPSLSQMGGWTLQGPGILESHSLAVGGLPPDFPAQREALVFPCGVDVVFTETHSVAALPRTTIIAR